MRSEIHGIAAIAEEWDELADEVRAAPFVRPGWIASSWRNFGRGSLRVLTVRSAGRLAGILPVAHDGAVLRSPTHPETPQFGFLVDGETSARGLAAKLLSLSPRHLELSLLASDELGFDAMTAELSAGGYRTIARPVLLSPFLGTQGEWNTYRSTIDAKMRSETRRRQRRISELGEVTFEVVDGSAHLESLLAEGFGVERSGWKGAHGTAIESDRRTLRFYRDIARWACERGWLRLAFLRLDGRPIAFDLCLETDGVHYLLKTGYDHGFSKFGPGVILRSLMLERAFSGPIETYEFLGTISGANNRWKLDWTDQYRERLRLDAFAPSLPGVAEWWAFKHGVPTLQRARAAVGAALGPSGKDLAKRGRRALRQLLPR
jgi:CelD/BcsL family acetyltransferase involved in cellulose biosynthesis